MTYSNKIKLILMELFFCHAAFAGTTSLNCTFSWYDCTEHPEREIINGREVTNVANCQKLGEEKDSLTPTKLSFEKTLYFSYITYEIKPQTQTFRIHSGEDLKYGYYFYGDKWWKQQVGDEKWENVYAKKVSVNDNRLKSISYTGNGGRDFIMTWKCLQK